MINIKSVDFGIKFPGTKVEYGEMMDPRIKYDLNAIPNDDSYKQFVVQSYHEMRMDLILMDMYGETMGSFDAIDVILVINGIDNPLNIKAGTTLIYPANKESIERFRYSDGEFKTFKNQELSQLGKANKNTRTDPKRKDFVNNGYSLPPTVNKTPQSPVRIESGKLVAGGVK